MKKLRKITLLETTRDYEAHKRLNPHYWFSLLNNLAQKEYLKIHHSKLRLTAQQQLDKSYAGERDTFDRIHSEHEMHKLVHKNWGIHLSDSVNKAIHWMMAGILAFTTLINTAHADDTDIYRTGPEIYTKQSQADIISHKQDFLKDRKFIDYYLAPNKTNPVSWQNLWNLQNIKMPPQIIKMVQQKNIELKKLSHSPEELRSKQIDYVNNYVNKTFEYKAFFHEFRSPQQIFTEKNDQGKYYGDCKDYYMAKVSMLREMGVKSEDMIAVFGMIEIKNQGTDNGEFGHIMLGVRGWNKTNNWIFLDINSPTFKDENFMRFPLDNLKNDFHFIPITIIQNGKAFNIVHLKDYFSRLKMEPDSHNQKVRDKVVFDPTTNTVKIPQKDAAQDYINSRMNNYVPWPNK